MPIYRYDKAVTLSGEEPAMLTISFGNAGTAAHHLIDIPGPDDKQALDQCEVNIGTLTNLSGERTLVFTKAVNINPNASEIQIVYKINGQVVATHVNRKIEDPSPQIVLRLHFEES